MKRLVLIAGLVAACAAPAVPVYLKPGIPAQIALREEAICREQARRSVPERPRATRAPGITIGVSRCTGNFCVGVNRGAETFDYDTNTGLRGEAIGACMGARGYRLITLPACTGSAQILSSHPFDTTGLCVAQGSIAAPR